MTRRDIGVIRLAEERDQHVVRKIFDRGVPFDGTDRKVVGTHLSLRLADRADAQAQRPRVKEVRVVGLEEGLLVVFHGRFFGAIRRDFRVIVRNIWSAHGKNSRTAGCREPYMHAYKNLAGNSGIESYEILREGVKVRFKGGATYLYDYRIPGRKQVEDMKRLALAGKGLSTYIAQHGVDYADKWE